MEKARRGYEVEEEETFAQYEKNATKKSTGYDLKSKAA